MVGRRSALFAAVLAASPAARAQEASPAQAAVQDQSRTVAPLVVLAPPKAMSREDARKLATTFARALSAPSRLGQISRWMDRPCAEVVGLPAAFGDFVVHRVNAIAEEVGAPTGSQPCKTSNTLVVFTPEPQTLLDVIARRKSVMLGFHYAAQRKRLARFKGPVQAWYVTATSAGNGVRTLDTEFSRLPLGGGGSRLSTGLNSSFEAVLVVVDSKAIAGLPIGRVADEVAMRVLARPTSLQDCQAAPSILDALKPACPASAALETLTGPDRAYLRGLYSADPRQVFSLQRAQIASHMARELEGERDEPRKAR